MNSRQPSSRPNAPALTWKEWRSLFAYPIIRVALNWDRLEAHQPHVEARFWRGGSDAELARIATLWYVNEEGECGWDAPGATQLLVGEIVEHPALLSLQRQRRIASQAATFAPTALTVATYVCEEGELILDGSHRLVAACLAGGDFSVQFLSVHGPADPEILVDLGKLRGR